MELRKSLSVFARVRIVRIQSVRPWFRRLCRFARFVPFHVFLPMGILYDGN